MVSTCDLDVQAVTTKVKAHLIMHLDCSGSTLRPISDTDVELFVEAQEDFYIRRTNFPYLGYQQIAVQSEHICLAMERRRMDVVASRAQATVVKAWVLNSHSALELSRYQEHKMEFRGKPAPPPGRRDAMIVDPKPHFRIVSTTTSEYWSDGSKSNKLLS